MQFVLPLRPRGARPVNKHVDLVRDDQRIAVFANGVPVFACAADDEVGVRMGACQLVELKLAKPQEVCAAFGLERTTLYRCRQRMQAGGVGGLVPGRRGPKGAHKLTDERLQEAQRHLTAGCSMRATAKAIGVSEGTIRHAVKAGRLSRVCQSGKGSAGESEEVGEEQGEMMSVGARSQRSVLSSSGVGVWREEERLLARQGQLQEALPEFESQEGVEYGGMMLALPALLEQGVLEGGRAVYGSLRAGFYGLEAVLLTLVNMALLRVKSAEQLQYHAPGELGVLLGLDRMPEVKTVRRKVRELAEQGKAAEYSRWLARRWLEDEPESVGVLYVDGHVRPYHGRKHELPKTHVACRRLCMDATTDYWVHTLEHAPLLVVTAEANERLLWMLSERLLPEVRELVGDERRVTVVFDREGWSPRFFGEMLCQGFDVLTYRKGKQERWLEDCFFDYEVERGGKKLVYRLAERSVRFGDGLWLREIRRLCESGHQTAVITSRQDGTAAEWAERMFRRWGQENFFRYMRQEYALDALVSYRVEPASGERMVPNPEKKAVAVEVRAVKAELRKREQEYAEQMIVEGEEGPLRRRRREQRVEALAEQIRMLRAQERELKKKRACTPSHVPLERLREPTSIVRLGVEEKHLLDTLKMVAYRAETALVGLLAPHYHRCAQAGRALVRELLHTRADIVPDASTQRLRIRLHPLANPRSNHAAAALCQELNKAPVRYPNTSWVLHYEAPYVAENNEGCQEV